MRSERKMILENRKILEAQLALKKQECDRLSFLIRKNQETESKINGFVFISWNDMEKYLKENGDNGYENNPIVRALFDDADNRGEYETYCKLKEGELQIGPYFHNDRFPRGCDLLVNFSRKWS